LKDVDVLTLLLVYIQIETYATQSDLDLCLLGTSQTFCKSENHQEDIMINTRITDNRAQILSLANQHGIKSMKIFGSMARGDATETSDADFLVEMEEGYDLFDLGSCLMELQELLHCKVDMVTTAALHPRIRENILKEAQPL
jgi:predicted nucleotidyltransferase